MKTGVIRLNGDRRGADETVMTESELLRSFIERKDEAAFAALVQRHGPLVSGVCRRVLRNHHDAEDAFQATFLILARKAASISRRQSLANWLYRVAYNTALNAQVTLARRRTREKSMTQIAEPAAGGQDLWPELEPILDRELSRLPDKYREPLVLCDLEGKTRYEAARQLGWPEATVSTRLTKARSILAQRFARHGFVVSAGAMAVLLSQNAAGAAVPASLASATAQAATLFAGGKAATAGVVSTKAALLTKGGLHAMLLAKVKLAAAAALVALAAVGVGLESQRPAAQPAAAIAAGVTLPAEVREALEQNAQSLSPINLSYTCQLQSKLSEQETRERLKLSPADALSWTFKPTPYRTALQDQRFYASLELLRRTVLRQKNVDGILEWSFDGTIQYRGEILADAEEPGHMTKRLKSRGRIGETPLHAISTPYFERFSGLSFRQNGEELTDLLAQSDVLRALQDGGQLQSVENVLLEDRPCLKIDMVVPNPTKRRAGAVDLEQLGSRTINYKDQDGKEWQMEAQCTPAEQAELVENIVRQRNLPATKRVVYFLDPALHYAVRRREEWYEPDQLLRRCDCREFQQLSDRPLWLPRRCESEIHEFDRWYELYFDSPTRKLQTSGELSFLFEDSFLSEVIEVSELSGMPAPDEQFVLNYTQPGMSITDDTLPVSEKASKGSVSYVVGKTPEETQQNIATALREERAGPAAALTKAPQSRIAFRWILVANVLAALLIASFLFYRRFAKSR